MSFSSKKLVGLLILIIGVLFIFANRASTFLFCKMFTCGDWGDIGAAAFLFFIGFVLIIVGGAMSAFSKKRAVEKIYRAS